MSGPDEHLTADTADAYLHDLLDADQKARVDRDCAECETCRATLEQARKRLAALTALPPHEPSEQLIQSTLKAVEARETRLRRLRRRIFLTMGLATAAAVLVLKVGVNELCRGYEPPAATAKVKEARGHPPSRRR